MLSLKCIFFIQYKYKWPRVVKWKTRVTLGHQNSRHQLYPPTWLPLKFRFTFLLTMWVRLDNTPSPTWQARQPVQSIVIYPKQGFPRVSSAEAHAAPCPSNASPSRGCGTEYFPQVTAPDACGHRCWIKRTRTQEVKSSPTWVPTKPLAPWRKGERTWQGDSAVTRHFFISFLAKWGKIVNFLSI